MNSEWLAFLLHAYWPTPTPMLRQE